MLTHVMEAPRMADLHTHNERYGAQKNQIFQKDVLDSTLFFTGYSVLCFLDHFKVFHSFPLHYTVIKEKTTGTQTDEAHRYYVQGKKRQTQKSIYCMIPAYSGGRGRLDRLSKVRLSEGVLIPAR